MLILVYINTFHKRCCSRGIATSASLFRDLRKNGTEITVRFTETKKQSPTTGAVYHCFCIYIISFTRRVNP